MQQCGVWRPKHRPCGFICGQRASGVDALCAMHCAMLHHHCGGKLGGAVAAGMSNTLGHGPAGKQTGDAWSSRGEPQLVASQECNVARGEDHNVVCVRLRQQNLEEVFLQFGRLAIACFFICSPLGHSLLLHFSSVRLASAYFFLACKKALCPSGLFFSKSLVLVFLKRPPTNVLVLKEGGKRDPRQRA